MTLGADMKEKGINQGQGNESGMVQGQFNGAKNDGNNEEEKVMMNRIENSKHFVNILSSLLVCNIEIVFVDSSV